ncbi:iron-containing redox enzyme family protein [Pseudonocardia sp. KRD291]|uniref:iron-containing redox enzyme family protein n=1 Tax=Pseudonocardia sp. KRD291 TaxID=2792007 RepID=UPI001C4A1531|nr:iron-containing redox enzyme family protein [Pseudonocardia sp. KRD291]MBW0103969.1 iron-containing redox enzyme family protein [Pseudonocardia sp. KRD291]
MTTTAPPPLAATGAPVPQARGPLSEAVRTLLLGGDPGPVGTGPVDPGPVDADGADPYGDDLQLALHCCYELHYRGFDGVDDDLEWDPRVLGVRRELERVFVRALRADVAAGDDVDGAVEELLTEPVGPGAETGVSHHLLRDGELWQLREYVAHRSIYHLKEADPQAWVIPRLPGAAKAGLVTVEHDEYGGGDPDRMHARLFADMMGELDVSPAYGAHVDAVPGATLAEVNFMSLCGLHRSLRGALVGQFAVVELTSSPGSARLVRAMRRLGCGPASIRFYDEHVEADAVHEQIIRRGVLAPLLEGEPGLAADVVFGIRASGLLGDRLGDLMLARWREGRSSLRRPLPGGAAR